MANDDRLTIKVKKNGAMTINKEGGAADHIPAHPAGASDPQINVPQPPGAQVRSACIVVSASPECAWLLQGGNWTKVCW